MVWKQNQPEQSPNSKRAELLARYLDLRGWSPARLAKESGQSKATISRIMSCGGDPDYRPELRKIQAIALALKLSREQRRELFYTVYPEFSIGDEATEKGYTVDETNELLYDKELPLLFP